MEEGSAVVAMPDVVTLVPVGVAAVVASLVVTLVYYYYYVLMARPPALLPLDEDHPVAVPLIDKKILSHDTRRFTFGLPDGHVLGLPTGQHVALKYTDSNGKAVQRSYTPVTDNTSVGQFSLVIKVYQPLPPKFPDGGLMSQHLDALKIGDTIQMRGPKGHVHYYAPGHFSTKPLGKPRQERSCRQIGMMAGGTGITPMLQILHAIFRNPRDRTKVSLLYANQTEDDILVRTELEQLVAEYPDRFRLWYTVDKHANEKNWKYDVGYINKDMVEKHLLFGNDQPTQFFMCGPPPMIKYACTPALEQLGYTEKDWVIF